MEQLRDLERRLRTVEHKEMRLYLYVWGLLITGGLYVSSLEHCTRFIGANGESRNTIPLFISTYTYLVCSPFCSHLLLIVILIKIIGWSDCANDYIPKWKY